MKKGLTIVEVLVAMLLVAGTLAALVNIFVAGKRYILHSRSRMSGGELGRFFLDPLQMEVRQDQWGVNCVSAQIGCPQVAQVVNGMPYNPQYVVTPDITVNTNTDNIPTTLSRIQLTLQWQENNP